MHNIKVIHCACAVSAGPDDADDVAPNAGDGAELEERCCAVETTMRRMLIRNRRLTCKGKRTLLDNNCQIACWD